MGLFNKIVGQAVATVSRADKVGGEQYSTEALLWAQGKILFPPKQGNFNTFTLYGMYWKYLNWCEGKPEDWDKVLVKLQTLPWDDRSKRIFNLWNSGKHGYKTWDEFNEKYVKQVQYPGPHAWIDYAVGYIDIVPDFRWPFDDDKAENLFGVLPEAEQIPAAKRCLEKWSQDIVSKEVWENIQKFAGVDSVPAPESKPVSQEKTVPVSPLMKTVKSMLAEYGVTAQYSAIEGVLKDLGLYDASESDMFKRFPDILAKFL